MSGKITVGGILHGQSDRDSLSELIRSSDGEHSIIAVECSLYLGGFLPRDSGKNIIVLFDNPRDLVEAPIDVLYFRGRDIPESSLGIRRLYEILAREISADEVDAPRIASELLQLRDEYADQVVYNEPKAWLRTVWYESDLLLHYLAAKKEYRLFGCLVYSDMDTEFGTFVRDNAESIDVMSGEHCLVFTFDGRIPATSRLSLNGDLVRYGAVVLDPGRLEFDVGTFTPEFLDSVRLSETNMLAQPGSRNRSLAFADRVGVRRAQTPCIVFWDSLEDNRVVIVPVGSEGERLSSHLKQLFDIVAESARSGGLDQLEEQVARLNTGSPLALALDMTVRSATQDFLSSSFVIESLLSAIVGELERCEDFVEAVRAAFINLLRLSLVFLQSRMDLERGSAGDRCAYLFSWPNDEPPPSERALQQDFFDFVQLSPLGQNISLERSNIGGGRADLLVDFGSHRFPIEIKRDLSGSDRERARRFLGQAAAYQSADVGLGLLFVLDLAKKPMGSPPLSANVWVEDLGPAAARRQVVVVRVPGNRSSPSGTSLDNG